MQGDDDVRIVSACKRQPALSSIDPATTVPLRSQARIDHVIQKVSSRRSRKAGNNLDSHFLAHEHVLPLMRKSGWGRIVNIASNAVGPVTPPCRGFSHYIAPKMRVVGVTRSGQRTGRRRDDRQRHPPGITDTSGEWHANHLHSAGDQAPGQAHTSHVQSPSVATTARADVFSQAAASAL